MHQMLRVDNARVGGQPSGVIMPVADSRRRVQGILVL